MSAKKKTVKKRLDDTIEEMAVALYDIGAIDTITMREFQSIKVPPVRELSAQQIKRLRLKQKVSQAVFAKLLNTSIHTIQEWEQGKKHPRGISLKLLNLVENRGISILVS